jgi:hypothetical protein
MSERLRTDLLVGLIIIIGYILAFTIVSAGVMPLQNTLLPSISPYAALVFLPHGVRVLATWLYREKALIPLLVAHLLMYRLFYWHSDDAATNMVAVLSGSFCAFIALQLFNFSRIDVSLNNLSISHWRTLIVFGFMASIFNALGNTLALGGVISSELHIDVVIAFIIGDTLGTAACLLILMLLIRLRRHIRAAQTP